jgi:hypothetical protein
MLGLKKEVDEANPEAKKTSPANNKSKGRSLRKLSEDAANVEAQARRITRNAASMENATRK